jgi:hypothetical protein
MLRFPKVWRGRFTGIRAGPHTRPLIPAPQAFYPIRNNLRENHWCIYERENTQRWEMSGHKFEMEYVCLTDLRYLQKKR